MVVSRRLKKAIGKSQIIDAVQEVKFQPLTPGSLRWEKSFLMTPSDRLAGRTASRDSIEAPWQRRPISVNDGRLEARLYHLVWEPEMKRWGNSTPTLFLWDQGYRQNQHPVCNRRDNSCAGNSGSILQVRRCSGYKLFPAPCRRARFFLSKRGSS